MSANEYAFPAAMPAVSGLHPAYIQEGMTLRDWFAGMALQGYIAYSHPDSTMGIWPKDSAEIAYKCADAMLAARGKEDA